MSRDSQQKKPTDSLPMEKALSMLDQKAHTRQELSQKLATAGVGAEDSEYCLERLESWGYLNDREYAAQRVKKLQAKLRSRDFIRNDLALKGIDAASIDIWLDEWYPMEMEKEIAGRLLAKSKERPGTMKKGKPDISGLNPFVRREISHLKRGGFSEETIEHCFPGLLPLDT